MNKLNFDKIKSEKTIVGGLANGEYKVLLTGFDVVPDSKGNPNYQMELSLVEFERVTKKFNTSIYSMYKSAVSNIGTQLGFDPNVQIEDAVILAKATKNPFSIWINRTDREYINFYEYVLPDEEDEEAVAL